ncbi:hypothetical protein GE09DRAFT_65588 [Coniochaeta sp. 2T2.1]|nr:hypothetical protein GE09DRAFT_65588 [Coniochaeta sp. 2T2.1]
MAAAVLVPMSTINLNGGVLPSSAISGHNSPRHGRSRGVSISKGKGGRGRGYSVVDDRETTVSKAVVFVLKRAATVSEEEEEKDESDGDDDKITADAEGWVDVDDVLSSPKVSALSVTLTELQELVSSTIASKTRQLSIRQLPNSDPANPSSYEIRRAPKLAAVQAQSGGSTTPSATWTKLTASTPDLPEFILHETTYPKYHLILTSGSIKRAGGQPFLSFASVSEDATTPTSAADVSIWIHLPSTLESHPEITWQRTDSGSIVTADEVPKALWKRAVARRGDLGVLFEDGVVRKEVPFGLRGKGAKAKKGKGVLKSRGGEADDGSDSASASAEE